MRSIIQSKQNMHGKALFLFTILFPLTIGAFVAVPANSQQTPAVQTIIKKDGLLKAIRLNGLTTEELIDRIKERGVDFQVTPDVEKELQDAGADSQLIKAVRDSYRTPTPPTPVVAPSSSKPVAQPASHSNRPPLNNDEVLTLLQSGVPSERVEKLVADRGVNFTLNTQISQTLRTAGAMPSLIASIAEHLSGQQQAANATQLQTNQPSSSGSDQAAEKARISARYDELIDKATDDFDQNNTSAAARDAKSAIDLDPTKAAGYTMLAHAHLVSHEYSAAERTMRKAIERGGFAVFRVYHADSGSEFQGYCIGSLFIGRDMVKFRSNNGAHTFEARLSDVTEVKTNGYVGESYAAFHIKVKDKSGKTRNYNFAPFGASNGILNLKIGGEPPEANVAEKDIILRMMTDYKPAEGSNGSSKPD